jgi:predicted dienelactone hydrolase
MTPHRTPLLALLLTGQALAQTTHTEIEFELTDPARGRTLAFLIYLPQPVPARMPVIVVSHGGDGNTFGHTQFPHLGTAYASAGYLSVHINHRPSADGSAQVIDRPADVSFTLDALGAGLMPLPQNAYDALDLDRVGHTGHSFGAYTAHAVAGAVYTHGTYRDERIDAVAPISPQGEGQFGAFNTSALVNTWVGIDVPTFDLVGELEISSDGLGNPEPEGWRLQPFSRYAGTADRFLSIVPGADHGAMGSQGDEPTQSYIAQNTLAFFDVYLRDRRGERRRIGLIEPLTGTVTRIATADVNNDGSVTPADFSAWIAAFNDRRREADANTDGAVTSQDFAAWIGLYNEATR